MEPGAHRSKTIGTKVTEAEYARLEARARAVGKTVGEWCREVLLSTDAVELASAAEQAVLEEVLALRTILLNLGYGLARGEAMTPERMRELIGRADGEKEKKAAERLTTPQRGAA